jgi:hypothetical protein
MSIKNNFYSLEEIATWQSELSNGDIDQKITLPSLQRGFVWKPHQMEALWDSILRGYPIGSLLMSSDGKETKFLLDGQQRCTSIALGFHNPMSLVEKKIFALRKYLPSIWIDLKPGHILSKSYRFSIRVLTKSHPWGYDQKNNTSALTMRDRREALAYFKTRNPNVKHYTDLLPSKISPWDAYYPVPLSIVLQARRTSIELFTEDIKSQMADICIRTKHSKDNDVDFNQLCPADLEHIFDGVERALQLTIPEITISNQVLLESDNDISESQDPTLFIRLNSAGTALSGEELIYSIFKAMYPSSKDLVENIGASYLSPKRIISIFSRLTACKNNDYTSVPPEYNIKTFRTSLSSVEFRDGLKEYINQGELSLAEQLINSVVFILSKGNVDTDIPTIVIKQWMVTNNELFLLLLIYLEYYALDQSNLDFEVINDISSAYVHLLWFSKDKKITTKLFDILIANKEVRQSPPSWREAINTIIQKDPSHILQLIDPESWRKVLVDVVVKQHKNHKYYVDKTNNEITYNQISTLVAKENYWNDESLIKNLWDDFLGRIFWNKTMLLYAQRKYINDKFGEYNQFENIEDTNRPWDWDHIYPNSWVYNKNRIHDLVKAWVNSIGNYRALSYDENRSENNHESPMERLNSSEKRETSFVLENDFKYWNLIVSKRIYEGKELDDYLNAVVNRTVNIYKEWYVNYYQAL